MGEHSNNCSQDLESYVMTPIKLICNRNRSDMVSHNKCFAIVSSGLCGAIAVVQMSQKPGYEFL